MLAGDFNPIMLVRTLLLRTAHAIPAPRGTIGRRRDPT
jgi:hypothetical protein